MKQFSALLNFRHAYASASKYHLSHKKSSFMPHYLAEPFQNDLDFILFILLALHWRIQKENTKDMQTLVIRT